MDRTYITFQGANHLVAGTTEEVLQRWEQALAAGTMLRFKATDSEQLLCVNPRHVETIGSPLGSGNTLLWA